MVVGETGIVPETRLSWLSRSSGRRNARANVLGDAVLDGAWHAQIVDHGQVLPVFAEAHAARVHGHRQPVLGRHQHDGQHLVDAAQPTRVELQHVDGAALDELLEQHAVLTHVDGGHQDARPDVLPYLPVAVHVTNHGTVTAASSFTHRTAWSGSHTWLASINSRRSGYTFSKNEYTYFV